MVSLSDVASKWSRKTSGKGDKWKREVKGKGSDVCAGLMKIEGIESCGIADDYDREVAKVSASDFNSAIEGKKDKWKRNFKSGIAA